MWSQHPNNLFDVDKYETGRDERCMSGARWSDQGQLCPGQRNHMPGLLKHGGVVRYETGNAAPVELENKPGVFFPDQIAMGKRERLNVNILGPGNILQRPREVLVEDK